MKIEGKFILKVAGTLTAISLVVAALLGATNALTEDKIAARRSRRPLSTPPRRRAASSPRPTASS